MAKVSTGVLGVVEYILLRLMQMAYQVFNTLRFTRITISNTHGVRQPGTLSRSKSALRLSSCHSDLGGISITSDTCVLRTTSATALKLPKSKSFAGVGIVAMVTDQIDIVSRNETAEDRRAREGQDMVLRFSSCTDSTRSYAASNFTSTRGRRIFVQKWTPAPPLKMKATVVLLHGLNEHGGRYEAFARALNQRGYGAFCMDWTGHGCSEGLHGLVDRLDHVVTDTRTYMKMVRADHPDVPCFLFGHSTGGALALKASLQSSPLSPLVGMVLTSPAIQIEIQRNLLTSLAPLVSALLPTFPVPRGTTSEAQVTRDPVALQAKYSDPLVYTGGLRARTGWEIYTFAQDLYKRLEDVHVPFLVMHGGDDTVTEPNGSRALFQRARSEKKDIKIYDGLLHDLLFEFEKEEITTEILDWMDKRMANFVRV